MSMRMAVVRLASVGCKEYDVDEDSGEDDAASKNNHE